MADKDEDNGKKKRTSIIASLDLKNYKAKYTDSYGLGKPSEADIDNFLIAEPDPKSENKKNLEQSTAEKKSVIDNKVKNAINSVSDKNIDKPYNSSNEDNEGSLVSTVSIASPVRDSDFDKRVNAEADNDFYDEKPSQQIGDTFRSNVITHKSTADDESAKEVKEIKGNRKLNLREPITVSIRHEIKDRVDDEEIAVTEKKPIRRTETYGVVISAVALLYSIAAKDKALLFLSVALFLYLIRPVIAAPFGKYSQAVQNAIKGFSIALFFGSIFFIFF